MHCSTRTCKAHLWVEEAKDDSFVETLLGLKSLLTSVGPTSSSRRYPYHIIPLRIDIDELRRNCMKNNSQAPSSSHTT